MAASLLLLWRVLEVNGAAYDDEGTPRIQAHAPELSPGPSADRTLLRRALRDNPAHVEALLLLAIDHERAAKVGEARRAYQVAFELAPLDREVLTAAAGFFLRHDARAESLALLDRLVESYPDARPAAFPVIARILEQRSAPAAFDAIVARKPAWLGPFTVSSCEAGLDPSLLMPILLERVAGGRATAAEHACVIDRLRNADRWPEAYHVWLNTLSRDRLADVGYVFNGSFEQVASGLGFDWRPTRSRERETGHSVDMPQAAGVNGIRALRVSYNGKRQVGVPIGQYLAIPPGRYEMSGLARAQSISAGRGVRWTVRCVKAGVVAPPLAASERFVGSSEWRPFSFEVVVPANCSGQLLQLEALGAEDGPVFLSGTAWFDALVLRRRG
ncbi:MAG TPA: hypothetical protein VM029_15410 [Opitutaceae bacterium]|nr:hypothetical protein [Opitutaceae bacterium]